MITSPYNFVPLNKEVFYPDWDQNISHDIPFKDGESGSIDITITAQSPIYIRNHYQDGDEYYKSKSGEIISKEFCHAKMQDGSKQYYIPGTSIKGMTRSVLEILSFSKIDFMDDAILSVRDMTNQKELVGNGKQCGFLVKKEEGYAIEKCGKPRSISFSEVKAFTGVFTGKMKTAAEKYKAVKELDIPVKKATKMMTIFNGKQVPKDIAIYDKSSTIKARLVLTGAINNKKNEFVFIKNGQSVDISDTLFKGFKAAYFHENSTDGQYWEKEWKKGSPIPVFYESDPQGNITQMGLTQLFKLAYNKTLKEAAKQNTQKDRYDLAQCIFGMVSENDALKGRVQFSHMKSSHVTFESEKSEILGEPNATYYPNYIRQTNVKNGKVVKYKTLMDSDAEISGWKRYPLHESIVKTEGGNDNEDVRSKFKPLNTGSKFSGKIRFHNLKKAEIGALLSALTFHGQEETHMHNMGMAKALGYGKVSIKLTLNDMLIHEKEEYLNAFESLMESKIQAWKNAQQLQELFAMANVECKSNAMLKYQLLENPQPKYNLNKRRPEANDFTGAKKNKEYLLPYSEGKHSPADNVHKHKNVSTPAKSTASSTQIKNNTPHKPAVPVKQYSIQDIATKASKTVQEVIDFSVGLHFGKLTPHSSLKEQQANDLLKRLKGEIRSIPVKQPVNVSLETEGISKNKLRKVVSAYWQKEFSVMYHRNQIKEFLSGNGFDTTPEEQRAVYLEKEGDDEFKKLCQLIFMFEFGNLDDKKKEALYKKLTNI